MLNSQTYSWVYIGYSKIRDDEDMYEYELIKSTVYTFPIDYDAIEHALEYKKEISELLNIRYICIKLFLIIIDNIDLRIVKHDYILSC